MDEKLITVVDDVLVSIGFQRRSAPRWVSPKTNNSWDRGHMSGHMTDYTKKPRIYPSFNESVLDNLVNRTSRDSTTLGRILRKAMKQLELPGKVGWSQKAGCSCPCSPGWVWDAAPARDIDGEPSTRFYDVWVSFGGLDPNRHDPEAQDAQANRLAQFVADPTLPFGKEVLA